MNHTKEAYAQRVRELIAQQLHMKEEDIHTDATLQSLGADSLDVVELIMRFEDEFQLEINDEDAAQLHSVQDLTTYVVTKMAARNE